jgi:phenylacetate-coenzyme A ligase PaaK-like adenylate-forming protein
MTDRNIEDTLTENVKRSYSCSYEDSREYHAKMLASITESAQRSPVYRGRIKKASSLEHLADLPMTVWKDVEDAVEKDGLENVLLAKPLKFWQTSGYSGEPKKIYYSERDIDGMHLSILEMLYVTGAFETDMSIWNIGVADPYLPGTLFDDCFGKYIDMARTRVSYYSEAATDEDGFVKTLNMISQVHGVNILIAFPVVYYLIAMSSSRPEWLESKVIDGFCRLMVLPFRVLPSSLGKMFARLYLRKVDYANIRDILGTAKTGYVFGESLDPYQPFIDEHYPAMTFFNILGSTEMLVQAFQATPATKDLSVVLKNYIPEIASVEDVEAAKSDPARKLKAVPWYDWKKGMRGELVITRPGDCLPLIRYPTGDYVEVVDPARTITVTRDSVRYDITLPLIKVLSRTMDMVDFEAPDQSGAFFGFKFYSKNLSDAMQRVGNVKWWEFYKLHGSPGRYMLWVVPETEVADMATFRKAITASLLDEKEDHAVSFSLAKELDVLDILVARPDAYGEIERTIQQRIRERQPLGRVKPRHIHNVKDEEEYNRIVEEKKKRA